MSLITWNASFSVGVPAMDAHHQKLIALINQLHDANASGKGKEIVVKIIDDLFDYAKYHFKEEEALLVKANSSELAEQRREHEQFIQKALTLKEKVASGKNLSASLEAATFLNNWLKFHILSVDKKYEKDAARMK